MSEHNSASRGERKPATIDYHTPHEPRSPGRLVAFVVGGVLLLAMAAMVVRYYVALQREQRLTRTMLNLAAVRAAAQAYSVPATMPAFVFRSTTTQVSAAPVAAIWNVAGYNPKARDALVVGVFSDGTVIWSRDKVRGGEPYFMAKLDPAHVDQLLRDLDTAGFFGTFKRTAYWGPDSGYKVIAAKFDERQQWFGSWHKPFSTNPNVVFTERGIHALQPGQAVPKPSAEYQHFIDTYERAKKLIEAVVPEGGEPIDPIDLAIIQAAFDAR